MKTLLLFCAWLWVAACNSPSGETGAAADSLAPREATDPVPAPPTQAHAVQTESSSPQAQANLQQLYRITGTEPFWSLTLGRPYSLYLSMAGDSIRFAYQPSVQAEGRPEEFAQLFRLGNEAWVVLRKGPTPCSDGMSDKEYPYTATLWLQGRLLDGCGEKR